MYLLACLCYKRIKEREESDMKNTILYSRGRLSGSSSICKELIENTRMRKIDWISYENFVDFLDIQGIAFDDIPWFHSYLVHIQKVRFFPDSSETFFTYYDNRLFSISQSKISREFRMDFTSYFDSNSVWRGVVDSQPSLSRLHSYAQIFSVEDCNEECRDLLYSTGCIHA